MNKKKQSQNADPDRLVDLPLYTGYIILCREEHSLVWEQFLKLIDVACWCTFYHLPATHTVKALHTETAFAELADMLLLLPQKELLEP